MTVILAKESLINQKVATIFAQKEYKVLADYFNIQDSEVTLIALEADGKFQENISPHFLAHKLQLSNLPKDAKKIELIVSDTSTEVSLVGYANALVNKMASLGYTHLAVSTAAILVKPTFLVPPFMTDHAEWELFTIPFELAKHAELNTLRKNKQKKLIWHGPDIYTWLSRPQQIFYATPTGLEALRSA